MIDHAASSRFARRGCASTRACGFRLGIAYYAESSFTRAQRAGGPIPGMRSSYSEGDESPVQLVQVAKLMARFLGGSYPPDIAALVRRYASPGLDPDYRAPTRPDLIGLIGRNEVAWVWLTLDRQTKNVLKRPERYHPKEYVAALEAVWRHLSTRSRI